MLFSSVHNDMWVTTWAAENLAKLRSVPTCLWARSLSPLEQDTLPSAELDHAKAARGLRTSRCYHCTARKQLVPSQRRCQQKQEAETRLLLAPTRWSIHLALKIMARVLWACYSTRNCPGAVTSLWVSSRGTHIQVYIYTACQISLQNIQICGILPTPGNKKHELVLCQKCQQKQSTLLMKLLFSFQGPTLKTFVQTLPLTSKHLGNKTLCRTLWDASGWTQQGSRVSRQQTSFSAQAKVGGSARGCPAHQQSRKAAPGGPWHCTQSPF